MRACGCDKSAPGGATKAGRDLSDREEGQAAGWRIDAGDEPGVLVLSGEIDFSVTPAARERLLQLTEKSTGDLVLDMAGLSYIDSSGLALLLEARKHLQEHGRSVRIRSIAPQVRKLLQLTQLGEMFGLNDEA
jgi:anti-sigma B factor antagonist